MGIRSFRDKSEESKYLPLINNAVQELKPRILKTLQVFSSEENVRKGGEKFVSSFRPTSERLVRRLDYYKKQPEIPVYIGAVLYLFLIKSRFDWRP